MIAGLEQAVELPAVQQLVAQPAVEGLDPGVLPRRAGIDEHGGDFVEPAPVGDGVSDELGSVELSTGVKILRRVSRGSC